MTVSSETARNDYVGNDVTVEFAVEFYFFIDADVKAILYNSTTETETVLTLTTHYTLAGAGNPAGGTLTMVTAPASDETLTILRDLTATQGTDYIEHSNFPANSHEQAIDRLTMLIQKYVEEIARTLKFKQSSTEVDVELEDLVANKAVIVNPGGTGLEMGPSADEISNAQTYAEAAATAQTAAETAQTAAELAETNAETAQAAAETAQTAAELAETNAETAEANAVTAKTAAETAQTAAELAETNAETAQAAAEAAQAAAETAEANAETAETNAETAAAVAIAAATAAETAQAAAETAQAAAETAQAAAEAAQAAAEAAAASLNIATPVASKHGALLYQNDEDDGYDLLEAQGTAGQQLISNGPDAAPSFQTGDFAPLESPVFTTKITTPIIDLTGGQIAFPATAVPSADANTLDDYEEGTWTPGISFGGGTTGITYGSQVGKYTKIGDVITIGMYISLTSNGTSSGAALITGLPFTPSYYYSVALRIANITFANQFFALINSGATTINLSETTEAGVRTDLTEGDLSDTAEIFGGGTYKGA